MWRQRGEAVRRLTPVLASTALVFLAACVGGAVPCGGVDAAPCADGDYCDTAFDCAPDALGVCRPVTQPRVAEGEVCGCDRVTYTDEAAALEAAVGLYYPGSCACSPPRVWDRGGCIPLRPQVWNGIGCNLFLSGCSVFGADAATYRAIDLSGGSSVCQAEHASCPIVRIPCDGRRHASCPRGLYCAEGQCRPAPATCDGFVPSLDAPVRGWDGRRYEDTCQAYRAGTSPNYSRGP